MMDSFLNRQIAGYRIERRIGRGGMASVYFAWDTANDRPVALKVLDERYRESPAAVERFVQEAQAIASWTHPNIVNVYDAGEDGGIYYYAMEFIRGLDLAELLRQYQENGQLLPYPEVLRIGWAVAEALDFAHRQGIVHRDVKPSNVLVSVDGRILLTDFGLVMDMARGTLGETFGSPHYIAPEQAQRSSNAVPQSDNYALGVMLYEMLAGVVPFHDPSPTALALKHLTENPPAPRALNPLLSQQVEGVLLHALRKSPQERFATAREMMRALEHALAPELDLPEAAQPIPAPLDVTQARAMQATADQGPPPPSQAPYYPPPSYNRQPRRVSLPATQGQPGWENIPPALPPNPPRRRSFFSSLGCAALLLAALVLVGLLGAGLVFANTAGLRLPGLLFPAPAAQGEPSTTPSPPPPSATAAPTLTMTPEPSATAQPSETPTETPTLTLTPTATETPLPPTPEPTSTPLADLLFVRVEKQGLVLVNQSEQEILVEQIQLRKENEDVVLEGVEFELETLQPGECLAVWERDRQPLLPADLDCEPVGKPVLRKGGERFWLELFEVYYDRDQKGKCPAKEETCEFNLWE